MSIEARHASRRHRRKITGYAACLLPFEADGTIAKEAFDRWVEVPDQVPFDNAFKIQWELFLKHVVAGEPFPWTLREGAKGVQLAELSWESHRKGTWVDVPKLA